MAELYGQPVGNIPQSIIRPLMNPEVVVMDELGMVLFGFECRHVGGRREEYVQGWLVTSVRPGETVIAPRRCAGLEVSRADTHRRAHWAFAEEATSPTEQPADVVASCAAVSVVVRLAAAATQPVVVLRRPDHKLAPFATRLCEAPGTGLESVAQMIVRRETGGAQRHRSGSIAYGAAVCVTSRAASYSSTAATGYSTTFFDILM